MPTVKDVCMCEREREREREHTSMYTCKVFYTMCIADNLVGTHTDWCTHSHNSQFDLAHSTPLHCYTSHFTNKCWEYLSPHMDATWRERSDSDEILRYRMDGWIPSHTIFTHVYMHVHVHGLTMATCTYMYMHVHV